MNPLRPFTFAWRNWRIIALCALVAAIATAALRYDHNRGRFMLVPAYGDTYPPYVIDTHTGQLCDPGPQWLTRKTLLPYCVDLAKNWQ
jgi:hypothetical protein